MSQTRATAATASPRGRPAIRPASHRPRPSDCTASTLRSVTTTRCPPSSSRCVMFAPIRPSPTIPMSMAASFALRPETRAACNQRTAQRLEPARNVALQMHAHDRPPMGRERLEVADRLRALQLPERERPAGYRYVARVHCRYLQEHAFCRSALVQLPGRVKEARTVAERRRDAERDRARAARSPQTRRRSRAVCWTYAVIAR